MVQGKTKKVRKVVVRLELETDISKGMLEGKSMWEAALAWYLVDWYPRKDDRPVAFLSQNPEANVIQPVRKGRGD